MSVPEGVAFLRSQLAEALRGARARGVVDPRTVPSESPPATSTAPTGGAPSPEPGMMPASQAHIDAIQRRTREDPFIFVDLRTAPTSEP